MKIQRTVETPAAPAAVFAYLSDFTTTTEWDPGTVVTERISGDGGEGTKYRNVSEFKGRKTELEYTLVTRNDPSLLVLHGTNKTVDATDRMEIAPHGTGTQVTYDLEVDLTMPMIGMLKRKAEKHIINTALTELKKRAEG